MTAYQPHGSPTTLSSLYAAYDAPDGPAREHLITSLSVLAILEVVEEFNTHSDGPAIALVALDWDCADADARDTGRGLIPVAFLDSSGNEVPADALDGITMLSTNIREPALTPAITPAPGNLFHLRIAHPGGGA